MGLEKVGHTNFTHRFGAMGVLSTSQDLAIFGRKIVQGSQVCCSARYLFNDLQL